MIHPPRRCTVVIHWNRIKRVTLDFIFPNRCPYCGKIIGSKERVCACCEEIFPRIEPPICKVCGRGVAFCRCHHKYSFDRCIAPFYYEGNARNGLILFKFRGWIKNAEIFAEEMAQVAKREYGNTPDDVMVYVPMTKQAVRKRGYNQSKLLAHELSKQLKIPVLDDVLVKCRELNPQHMVGMRERWSNVMGAFCVEQEELVRGKRVVLVDDVMTTGATLDQCARMLKMAGAKSVLCVVFASTSPQRLVKPVKVAYNIADAPAKRTAPVAQQRG